MRIALTTIALVLFAALWGNAAMAYNEHLAPDDLAALMAYAPTTTEAPQWDAPNLNEPEIVVDCGEFDEAGNFVGFIPCTFPEAYRADVERYFPANRVEQALRVMDCESGGDPNAFNPRSGASGLMQHLQRYWDYRSTRAGWAGADIFNPTANIAVAAWLAQDGVDKGLSYWHHWQCKP